MAFVNSYFDFNDFVTPIKNYIDDSLFFDLEPDRVKQANFYVMQSQVQLQDAYLQYGQSNQFSFS